MEKPKILGWKGKTMGINAIHIWRLKPVNGKTLVRTEESWEGFFVSIFRGSMRKTLEKAINAGPGHLKAESERRSRL